MLQGHYLFVDTILLYLIVRLTLIHQSEVTVKETFTYKCDNKDEGKTKYVLTLFSLFLTCSQ